MGLAGWCFRAAKQELTRGRFKLSEVAKGCLGGVQPSHRPKAGKHERFSLSRASQERPRSVPNRPTLNPS
jgi:hypothetical protein